MVVRPLLHQLDGLARVAARGERLVDLEVHGLLGHDGHRSDQAAGIKVIALNAVTGAVLETRPQAAEEPEPLR